MRLVLVMALATLSVSTRAQPALDSAEQIAHRSTASPLYLLLPNSIRSGYFLRDLIRSDAFGRYDSAHSASTVFNEIYYTAISLTHGNESDALFTCTFGCMEHEDLPIGLFGHEFRLPLTRETHSEFLRRQSHLPAHLYQIAEEDRDKLQHFYAGAWLKSWLGMDCLVALGGELVELFESTFVDGSTRDPRDIHANIDGAHFATKAAQNLSEPPSRSLTKNP